MLDPSRTGSSGSAHFRGAGTSLGAMDLLHTVLTRLLEDPDSTQPFTLLLADILELSGAEAGAVFVTTETGRQLVLLACTGCDDRARWVSFVDHHDLRLPPNPDSAPQVLDEPADHNAHVLAQWLTQGAHGHGLLLLRLPGRSGSLPRATIQAVHEYGDYLAGIIYSTRRARLKLRHAQCEERAAIARELHDSLAQSLSYLKIQASLLQSSLGRIPETAANTEVDATLKELRNTLNVAYRQLRELITTFRLTMHGKTFAQALEESIEEFERRCSIAFDLDNRLPAGELGMVEEMQLLHIVREALSNVVRHSHASYCWLTLRLTEDGNCQINITDNGVGMQTTHDAEQHHGVVIMQERAHSLGGSLRLERREGGGTRVVVTCPLRQAAASMTPEGM
jgi:two-component system nitrate/nitrite sensor histidine kinase NarX